ncbi:polysaccharide biosynthesis/export family protein [Microbulbifer aggregans]|uniref:polysaccharide biosynthesis/export family protein n=1 Tax=Microbulbifer aggregans TaxID=1769779 RepID=UPI001CFD9BFC|nr:polysaccharide biosynthesis/export family protein [Microbulbifer aggregans]
MKLYMRSKLLFWIVLMPFAVSVHAQVNAGHKLGAGDKVSVLVYGESDLSIDLLLDESGVINYPFLGEIAVSGLTPAQLENIIVVGLKGDYLVNPNVTVSMLEYRPIYIYGEVNSPGGYSYQPGLTVAKAAALAQGLTERASENRIYLIREDEGEESKEKIDMSTRLFPGDTVTIDQGFF